MNNELNGTTLSVQWCYIKKPIKCLNFDSPLFERELRDFICRSSDPYDILSNLVPVQCIVYIIIACNMVSAFYWFVETSDAVLKFQSSFILRIGCGIIIHLFYSIMLAARLQFIASSYLVLCNVPKHIARQLLCTWTKNIKNENSMDRFNDESNEWWNRKCIKLRYIYKKNPIHHPGLEIELTVNSEYWIVRSGTEQH